MGVMTKLGYPLLPVIVRAGPGLGTRMSEAAKLSPAIAALVILIGLCLVSPFCVIALSALSRAGSGTKHLASGTGSPVQQSPPVAQTNGLPAADAIDVRRSDSIPVPSSSPAPHDEPPDAFVNSAVVDDDETGIATHSKHKLPHCKAADGTSGSGNTHRRRGAPTAHRSEETAKSKTAHHRGKAKSTVNQTSHGEKRRAALSRQDPERIEKIRRIAYYLWLARRENNISGDADQDYFHAERIFESKTSRQLLLGSFCIWSVAYLAAGSPEAQFERADMAGAALKGIIEEHGLMWD
jgi:hypothetical protein